MHIGERNGSLPQPCGEDWNSPLHRQPHHLTEDALSVQIPSEEELNKEATYPTRAERLSSSSFSAPFFLLILVYLSGYWSTKKKASNNKIWSIIPRPFVVVFRPSRPLRSQRLLERGKSRNECNRKLCSVLQRAKSKDLSALA